MADVTFRGTLDVRKGNLRYRHPKTGFSADMDGTLGPTPGALLISTTGTAINLGQLVIPGFIVVDNYDADNFFTLGLWDPDTSTFYPFLEVGPGEFYPFKLSRFILDQFGTGGHLGTGSVVDSNQTLRAYADTADVNGFIGVFEK